MNYKQYEDPEELKKLQRLSVDVLRELDRVCRALGITYFAYGGTAIGAVRHGGFIPWDDDIDIIFLREDFERFLSEAPALLDSKYEVVSSRTEKYFPATNANLALKGTKCVPEEFDGNPYEYALGLGLYAYDTLIEEGPALKRQLRATWFWGRLKFLCSTGSPHIGLGGALGALAKAACHLIHGVLRLFHVSPQWVQGRWEAAATRYNATPTGRVADFADRDPVSWSATMEELFPPVEMAFDGVSVYLPHDYDTLLRRGYGDYLALPPEDDRKNHYPSKLDFGPY